MTAASMNILIIAAAAFISLLMLTPFSECGGQNTNTSPTVTLIHRDSSLSSTQRLAKAFQRSLHHHQLSAQKPLPNPTLVNSEGLYLLNYSIGSFSTTGTPATGSDLIWTTCGGRTGFDPRLSTPVPCTPTICDSLTNCTPVGRNRCNFNMTYFDGTSVVGDLFADTITFDDGTSASNITFGCNYTGTNGVGMVGLGGGELSLVHQLGQGRFSYCLASAADEKDTGKMSFGGSPVAGEGVVSVPRLQRPETLSYYIVGLEGIGFGNAKLEDLSSSPVDMIVDIGTTLTLLPQDMYYNLKSAIIQWVSNETNRSPLQPPEGWNIDLCFNNNTNKDLSARFPGVTVYMGGKAVTLGYDNVLVTVGPTDDGQMLLCLAALPTSGTPIYGNLAQADFLVGIDLVQKTVSFKKIKCGSL